MVAQSATQSASSKAGRLVVRTGQHIGEMVSNSQRVLRQQDEASSVPPAPQVLHKQSHVTDAYNRPSTNEATPSIQPTKTAMVPDKTSLNQATDPSGGFQKMEVESRPHGAPSLTTNGLRVEVSTEAQVPNDTTTVSHPNHAPLYHGSATTSPPLPSDLPETNSDENASTNAQHSKEISVDAANASVSQENQILAATDDNHSDEGRLKEGRAVPSTRIGRAFGFAQLGLGLAMGAAMEGVARVFDGSNSNRSGSLMVNESNSDRLASSLCRMRGAALKMGQMLSIQDESLLPPALSKALHQVRQGAEAMPKRQLLKQMETQFGPDWRQRFETFDEAPFAAASIGQVHRATILDPVTGTNPIDVVVKVQYPGVAQSIESDLRNLSMLVTMTGLSPKGLFIENVIRVGQDELKVECDYIRELENQMRIKQLVEQDPELMSNRFVVPNVIISHSTSEILTSEYITGGTIDKVSNMDQDERNRVGRSILYLTMKELFEWRFMQTDPNWGNFLYDVGSRTTGLVDFGAAREYSKSFVDGYIRIVWASANRDVDTLMAQSRRMNFLTGDENDEMLEAHKMSAFTVGEPFWDSNGVPFDFRGSNISSRMGKHTAVFLRHRLTPPPEEVYTLHRKLAGAYMLCIKLGSIVESRSILESFVRAHKFEDGLPHPI